MKPVNPLFVAWAAAERGSLLALKLAWEATPGEKDKAFRVYDILRARAAAAMQAWDEAGMPVYR